MATLLEQANRIAENSVYRPTTQRFDESKGVEGRTNSIINSGSSLMRTAATKAAQAVNARGLRNSSLGVQAGQQAVIESAVPIANADAQLYQQQALANQSAQNTAAQSNSQLRATLGAKGLELGEQGRQFDSTRSLEQQRLQESQRQFNVTDATNNRQFNATLDQRASEFARNMGLEYDRLSQADRQQLRTIAQQDRQLAESGRQFDRTNLLDTAKLRESQRQFDVTERGTNQRFNAELAERGRQADAQLRSQETIASLDRGSRERLAQLDREYDQQISGNEKLAGAYGTMMDNIAQIQNNPEFNSDTKRALIQQNIDMFEGYASFSSRLTGVNVRDLLNFTAGRVDYGKAPSGSSGSSSGGSRGGNVPGSRNNNVDRNGGGDGL